MPGAGPALLLAGVVGLAQLPEPAPCFSDRINEECCRFVSDGPLTACFSARFSKLLCKTAHVKWLCMKRCACMNLVVLGL